MCSDEHAANDYLIIYSLPLIGKLNALLEI